MSMIMNILMKLLRQGLDKHRKGHPFSILPIVFLFIVVDLIISLSLYGETQIWTIQRGTQIQSIHGRGGEGTLYLRLDEVVQFLGGRFTRITETDRTIRIDIGNHRGILSAGQPLFNLDGQIHSLSSAVHVDEQGWWVPIDWLQVVSKQVFVLPLISVPQARRLIMGQDSMMVLTVNVQPQATVTRIVFQSDTPLIYQLTSREDGALIEIQDSRAILPTLPQDIRDIRLRSIRLDTNRKTPAFILQFDVNRFRTRAYTLENPFRFIYEISEDFIPGSTPETSAPSDASEQVKNLKPLINNEFDNVVIDPGHGGDDFGTVGSGGTLEKDVTLAIAKRLKSLLEAHLGLKVFLTRETDVNVELDQRTAIANRYNADLFISIHANSTLRGVASGAETFYLSADWIDDETRKHLTEAEPSAFASDGTKGDNVLQLILWDMAQTAYLEESQRFARMIQESLNKTLGISNRGVKQAPFRVLMGANMPAVLVEVGFLNNRKEEQALANPVYQSKLSRAIYQSVELYVQSLHGLRSPEDNPNNSSIKDTGSPN